MKKGKRKKENIMSQPWKTDKWYVSPWNYLDEVTDGFTFAPEIKIHDMTLRDGEQQAGLELRRDDKIRIAEALAEAGVQRIEAGMPAVSKQDEEAIREIVKRDLGPEVFAFCRCVVDDVKLAADCGVSGIVIEIPASDHIIQHAYGWPLEKAIDLSVKATSVAKELGLYTAFFTIDATRADINWLLDLLEKVATEGHMDSLVLVDTMGGAHPGAIRYFVRKVKERFSQPLEAHFHNDFGLAVANTLEALTAGVDVAHVTLGGMSERAGAAALEEVVVALLTMYGVDVGMKYDKLYDLVHLATSLSGHVLAPNKAIVGTELFSIESGIPAAWTRRCAGPLITEVFPLHWKLMGQPGPQIVLGKGSGGPSIAIWLEDRGLDASPEQIEALTLLVKEKSLEKKGLLTDEEFQELSARVLKAK
jgi:isopropylmalate/homocitrate/citramalate synthase